MITSKAGQRLARAQDLVKRMQDKDIPVIDRYRIHGEFEAAAEAVADELIAGRHHEAEGD